MNFKSIISLPVIVSLATSAFAFSNPTYLEPGTLRLSHDLVLEGLLHRTVGGYRETEVGIDKTYAKTGDGNSATKADFGQSLLTEVATRITPGLFSRVLFELQADYADRFWRPINENHRIDEQGRHAFLRQAEIKWNKDLWYAHGFLGVGHDNWADDGDLFELYPASYPDDDYLRHSGSFGIYPDRYKQDLFLNISGRHAPQGFEAGGHIFGFDTAVAYGKELAWGLEPSFYARSGTKVGPGRLTGVYRDQVEPDQLTLSGEDNHVQSGALSYDLKTEEGNRWQIGVLYNPYRSGEQYLTADSVSSGQGLLGSSWDISQHTAKNEDGLAGRLKLDRHNFLINRDWIWSLDLYHGDILAGNKNQVDFRLGTDIIPTWKGSVHYTYRKPIEGPIPFLREGTIQNPGAIVSQPRGPESPFTVNWSNREAVFLVTTFSFDPTPGTNQTLYDPEILQAWNMNQEENARLAFSLQHRMSDYRTTIDRQSYYNEDGDIVFDSPAQPGAWPSDGFIHEGRILAQGHERLFHWIFGIAGGQQLAISNAAYSDNASSNKPITEYYSVEGRLNIAPFGVWGHYGSGVWAPDPAQFFFGQTFDRLWGAGLSYDLTKNTTMDLSYLAARQDDELFVTATAGSFDEWRFLFSHRFGFLFLFQEAARAGYRAQ